MDAGTVATETAFLGALVWAIVQYLVKPAFKGSAVDPKAWAMLVAVVVGGVYFLLPGVQGIFTQVGQLVLFAVGASTLHNVVSGNRGGSA